MRRWIGLVASLVVATGLIAAGGASASAATPTATVRPATCSGTIRITSFAFQPPTIAPGQSSAATLAARNCMAQTVQATSYWFGTWVGSTTGIPAGCPVIDPLPRSMTFAPNALVMLSTSYLVFPSCTATALQVTVRIGGSGGATLASRTATLTIKH
jgi:hypothetical protein